jgi:glycosyltransferase involved in cell wall biosynthesis
MKISVILPVYNASETLPVSLESLRKQGNPEIEVVFVNDGSTDGTSSLLKQFISEEKEIVCQLIEQINLGAAAARNAAIDHARGEWLVFLDADDSFCDQAFRILQHELTDDLDILGWDWFTVDGVKTRRLSQADYATAKEALVNLMGGTMKWNLWLYAIRREVIDNHGIRFVAGADMGEDMAFMLKVFACAKKVRQIHQPLYRYNASNPASISARMDERRRNEVSLNLESAERFFDHGAYSDLFKEYLPHLKLFIKLPLLIGYSTDNYRLWYSWFMEANTFAFRNKDLPFRTRLLQWLASQRMWGCVRAYNLIVYGILYRFLQKRGSSPKE